MGSGGEPQSPPSNVPPTSERCLTSVLRSAALHFRQEPPSNLRATHFRALTGRGAPTGNEPPAATVGRTGIRWGGQSCRLATPPSLPHASEREYRPAPRAPGEEPRPLGGSGPRGGVSTGWATPRGLPYRAGIAPCGPSQWGGREHWKGGQRVANSPVGLISMEKGQSLFTAVPKGS